MIPTGSRKTAILFQTSLTITTVSWKTAILFQNPLSITTVSWKTAILFQNPLLIATRSWKTAILFQNPLSITTGSRKTAILFQIPLLIATRSWKTATLFQPPFMFPTGSWKTAILFQISWSTLYRDELQHILVSNFAVVVLQFCVKAFDCFLFPHVREKASECYSSRVVTFTCSCKKRSNVSSLGFLPYMFAKKHPNVTHPALLPLHVREKALERISFRVLVPTCSRKVCEKSSECLPPRMLASTVPHETVRVFQLLLLIPPLSCSPSSTILCLTTRVFPLYAKCSTVLKCVQILV